MPETLTVKSRKEQIHDTAETLFRERGYSATSMRHIAAKLGIEAASIYSHVKSKEEILKSICFRMADNFFAAIDSVESGPLYKDTLRTYIKAHVRVILADLNATNVFFHDWKFLTNPALSDFRMLRKDYENSFKAILRDGTESGEFSIDDIDFTVKTMLSAMNMIHEWYRKDKSFTPEEIGDKMANTLINGILKP